MIKQIRQKIIYFLFFILIYSVYSMKEKNEKGDERNYVNMRYKGLGNYSGKVLKGCVKNATTKLSIGSIPSTYESIIYQSESKKAFGTSVKKFSAKNYLESSTLKINHSESTENSSQLINVSHSKQGYGPMIAKEKRQWMRIVKTPGPGTYETSEYKKRKRINRKIISSECKLKKPPLLETSNDDKYQKQQLKQPGPGPGTYQHDNLQNWNKSSQGFKSSFKTKVKRDGYIPVSPAPGPGTYQNISAKQNMKKCKTLSKGQQNKENIASLGIINEQKLEDPGPGWYSHEIPSFKPIYEKIKMSYNFLSSNSHIQEQNSKISPSYPIKRLYQNNRSKLINSSCFMSETKREPFGNQGNSGPTIKTLEQKYKNFHFNIKNNWL